MNSAPTVSSQTVNRVRSFADEQTGRPVRQLTDFEHGAHLGYFRMFRHLPDGRMLAWAKHEAGHVILIDPVSGDIELLPWDFSSLKFINATGRNWFLKSTEPGQPYAGRKRTGRELWHIDLPGGKPTFDTEVDDDVPGVIEDITCDGQYLILREANQDLTVFPIPTTRDVQSINHYFSRPRDGAIWTYHVPTGRIERILHTDGICPLHIDTSPTDPMLIRYALDMPETRGQRIWTIRRDGTENHPIRVQARGEMVTHEFWWANPNYIGYTYQDRREDPTVQTHHWAEYALAYTRLGIANREGEEVYLSDPLNSYHTHLYRSMDGKLVSGEGTDGNSFVFAAALDMDDPKLEMIPLATVHTEYIPFRGQGVDCDFSADGRWLVYADKLDPDKPHQLFAVQVDL